MNSDDFRCMRRGIPLTTLNKNDYSLLEAIEVRGRKKQRALLLLHGFSSSPAVFRLLLPSLIRLYDGVFCPVLAGHADNLVSFSQAKGAEWILQTEQHCRKLINEYEAVDVMGLSLGGVLASHLSASFPLHHLYLLAPALDLQLSVRGTLLLAKTLSWLGFKEVPNAAGSLFTSLHCEIAYRKLPFRVIIELLTLVKEFQFTLPQCPTDLFLGDHDEVVDSLSVANRFKDLKNTAIHWLQNSAHVIPLDGDLDSILACIKQNLATINDDLLHIHQGSST